ERQFSELLKELTDARQSGDQTKMVDLVLQRDEVISAIYGERFQGAINELDRLNRLLRSGNVRPISHDPKFPAPDREEYRAILERARGWQPALRRKKARPRSAIRISRDAEALAYIEWVNERLKQDGAP